MWWFVVWLIGVGMIWSGIHAANVKHEEERVQRSLHDWNERRNRS